MTSPENTLVDKKPVKKLPEHAPMEQFPVRDNVLMIAGEPITDFLNRVGKTPFYVYDKAIITQQVEKLRTHLPERIHLHYAMKANPMPDVVHYLSTLTDGLDVASHFELGIALATGIAPKNISFAGPGKSDEDLEAAITAGVIINVESRGELERIAVIAKSHNARPPIAIRVNPDFELKSSGMKMAGGAKPFGIDAEVVPELLQALPNFPVDFQGFHIFCGSQNLKEEAIIDAQTKTFSLAAQLIKASPLPVRWINIGGGLGVPYFPGEQRLDLTPIGENLERLLIQHQAIIGEDTEVVMELGRYLVAESGLYVSKVEDVKISRGETFVITNGGLHHHLAASGNFGQVIRKNYPTCVANRMTSNDKEIVSIVGPLCTPLDILANKMLLPKVQRGDLIGLYQSGAYGLSASPTRFLGHPQIHEYLV
ncbi:MAG: pyridoxal-dependent decarboxylase, exosortase A system-associated [Cellvibrionaceae bacterium]